MEMTKIEVEQIEKAMIDGVAGQVRELHELQLSLIGGGIGEVIVG
jgi:hypothetical protein